MPQTIVRHSLDEPSANEPLHFCLGSQVVVKGWAFLEPARSAPPAAALEIVGVDTGSVTRVDIARRQRPDVARHFGAESLEMAGFGGSFRVDSRFAGGNRVRLLQIEGPDAVHAVDLFSFTVAPAPYETHARRDLAHRFLSGSGLEIGALQRPLPVPDRCTVSYVDRMSHADLLLHYPELRGLPIQKPHLIDDGETLGLVADGSQDFVIANHFFEHCENPIRTIVTFTRVLKGGGVLYMAVPDKRFTFDIDRPVTAYATLAETFRTGRRADREALYEEWAAQVSHVPPAEVAAAARKLRDDRYSIHFNVWSLADLLQFLIASRAEFDLPFNLEWIVCSENEVIVILRKRTNADAR